MKEQEMDEVSYAKLEQLMRRGSETIQEAQKQMALMQEFMANPLYDRLRRLAQIVYSETLDDGQKVAWLKKELEGI